MLNGYKDKKNIIDVFYTCLGDNSYILYFSDLSISLLSDDEKETIRKKMYIEFFNDLESNGLNKLDFYKLYRVLLNTEKLFSSRLTKLFKLYLKEIESVTTQYDQVYITELMVDIVFHYVFYNKIRSVDLDYYKAELISKYNLIRENKNTIDSQEEIYQLLKQEYNSISDYLLDRINIGIIKINRMSDGNTWS